MPFRGCDAVSGSSPNDNVTDFRDDLKLNVFIRKLGQVTAPCWTLSDNVLEVASLVARDVLGGLVDGIIDILVISLRWLVTSILTRQIDIRYHGVDFLYRYRSRP